MDKVAMIKQAYAYGAAVALQELGYDVNTAQDAGVKLAEDEEGMHPALRALIGAGAGAGGGALLGAGLGAGGAALSRRLGGPSLAEEAMIGAGKVKPQDVHIGTKFKNNFDYEQIPKEFRGTANHPPAGVSRESVMSPGEVSGLQKMLGHTYVPEFSGPMTPFQKYLQEAAVGGQVGGAGGAGLGALGGGLYGGLSE